MAKSRKCCLTELAGFVYVPVLQTGMVKLVRLRRFDSTAALGKPPNWLVLQ